MLPPCPARAALLLLALIAPAAAAPPIVLYDPASTAPAVPGADLRSTTTTAPSSQSQPCGLTTPCTDLNTAANANIGSPFTTTIPMGLSGEASAGVSNHGQGGSIGVLGWMKPTDDTTIYVGVSVGASRWTGQKFTVVPAAPRP